MAVALSVLVALPAFTVAAPDGVWTYSAPVSGPLFPAYPPAVEPPPLAAASPSTAPEDHRVAAIRGLLAGRPLEPHAERMVATADAYGLDWRLIPAISFVESGGGANACGANAWGWDNCRSTFSSFEEGIERVGALLASETYSGRSTAQQLCIWVIGDGCTTTFAVDYVYKVAWVYGQLGGSFAMPAYPAEDPLAAARPDDPPVVASSAEATAPSEAGNAGPASPSASVTGGAAPVTALAPPAGKTAAAGCEYSASMTPTCKSSAATPTPEVTPESASATPTSEATATPSVAAVITQSDAE